MTTANVQERLFPMGVRFAIGAALLFGSTTPIAKVLISDLHPISLAAILYLGSGIGLSLTRFLTSSHPDEAQLTRGSLPWLLGAILFGGILAPVLLMTGLKSSPASSTSLLLNLEGVFTSFLAWVVFKENFDRRIALGMGFIVAGGIVLTCQNPLQFEVSQGSALIVLACFCWSLDNNLTQKISSSDPFQVAAIKGFVAGLFNLAIAVHLGVWTWMPHITLVGLFLGFLGYGLSLVLFVMALRHIGTARTGAYFSLAPFWGSILAILLLREPVSATLFTAGILMAAGIWIHVTESHVHAHEHEEVYHDHKHAHDEHHVHLHDEDVEPSIEHSHVHRHEKLIHTHFHFPDIHHRHSH